MNLGRILSVITLLTASLVQAEIVNRWSFNHAAGDASGSTIIDTISGDPAIVKGVGATFNGSSVILPGGSNGQADDTTIAAYVDLPNGLISSKTNLTIEIWATPLSAQNWSRLFDFGRTVEEGDGGGEWTGATAPGGTQMSDGIFLSLQVGGDVDSQRLESALDGAVTSADANNATTPGTEYHYVVTYEHGVGTYTNGGVLSWYRDGTFITSLDLPYPLSDIEDVNNWLGRSLWSADSMANVAYNEVRIYNHAMGGAEVTASHHAGPEPGILYRWSFDGLSSNVANGTVINDAVGAAPATVRGVGATSDGSQLSLPGTSTGNQDTSTVSAYIDLPNRMLSGMRHATIEIWATPLEARNWSRLFDFGAGSAGDGLGEAGEWTGLAAGAPDASTASDEFALTLSVGTDYNTQRLYARRDYDLGGDNIYAETGNPTTLGQQYHYVVTYEQGAGSYGAAGGRQIWYRNGTAVATNDLPYLLSDLDDVNNWLGRSQFSGDDIAKVAFNEVRIYGFAFSPAQVVASGSTGPDELYTVGIVFGGAPVAMPDSVVMHAGNKVLIDVLENDTGSVNPYTVVIATPPSAGTATVQANGTILYENTNTAVTVDSFAYQVSGYGGEIDSTNVTVNFSTSLRIANPALARPESPPSTFYQMVDAFPGTTFSEPICFASPPGETDRLFVCERMAKIQVLTNMASGIPGKQQFLDLQAVVAGRSPSEAIINGGNYEFGLLGLAFHPGYATNGYFYAAYSVQINGGSVYERISRFSVSTNDVNVADPNSELVLLQQLDEGPNHNGGDLHFGPDGYLYYSAGDEENAWDWRLNSQQLDKDFFAGLFRIDVDKKPGNLEPTPHAAIPTDAGVARFSVPIDNPFVHTSLGGDWDGTYNGDSLTNDLGSVRMEYWATGLRHAWRMSFDPATGDLWTGDVGQNTYEEVDRIVRGGNYGWVYREGLHDTSSTDTGRIPPAGFTSIDPVYEYVHGNGPYQGNSICGGYIYRGTRFPELHGRYVFCDSVSGNVWELNPTNNAVTRLTGVGGAYGYLVTMGIDPSNQDILFADYINGRILRLSSGEVAGAFPQTLSATGLFADLTDLSPNPGLLPYDINLAFWSDYAIKTRWFAIPDATNTMTWARDDNWSFPAGMLWVKHFDLETERGNPASRERIETRVLTQTASDYYGVSYRWNEAGTEAYLVPDGGVEFDLEIVDGGVTNIQRWGIPSRSECITCHTPQAGRSLGLTTRQMNMVSDMDGFIGNQLDLLYEGGYFANEPDPPNTLPRIVRPDEVSYPLEERARSYIAVNCAYCHRADGTVSGANWEGRPRFTLAETGLVNGDAVNNNANPANKYVVPGDTLHSIVYNRVAATNGFSRMPPLASNELDQEGIDLLYDWITNELPGHQDYAAWRLAEFGSTNTVEGELTANPDGDDATNWEEFVGGTDPNDEFSYLVSQISSDGSSVSVRFSVPDFRSAYVETAPEPAGPWVRWDVSGNNGIMRSAGTVVLTGPADDSKRFFRLVMEER